MRELPRCGCVKHGGEASPDFRNRTNISCSMSRFPNLPDTFINLPLGT